MILIASSRPARLLRISVTLPCRPEYLPDTGAISHAGLRVCMRFRSSCVAGALSSIAGLQSSRVCRIELGLLCEDYREFRPRVGVNGHSPSRILRIDIF